MTDLVAKYPLWTLQVKRVPAGPFLVGTCGCGWQSADHLRTVVIADEWDRHMLLSKPQDHMELVPALPSRRHTCDCALCADRRGQVENDLESEAELRAEKQDELRHENVT